MDDYRGCRNGGESHHIRTVKSNLMFRRGITADNESRIWRFKMTIKGRHMLFLGMAAVAIVATVAPQKAHGYEYEPTVDPYYVWDDPINNETSTMEEDAEAVAAATSGGTLTCYATVYTWATADDSARVDYMSSHAVWTKSWQWNGAPGTAPGGTLTWEHDGDGVVTTNAHNTLGGGGYAWSLSNADSETGSVNPNFGVYASGNANGYVTNDNYPTGGSSVSGVPDDPDAYPDNDTDDRGKYYYSMVWDSYEDGQETIPSGTGYVEFWASVWCDVYGAAGAGPTASSEAWADGAAHAGAGVEATFP
jgi:hypothetical protein